MTIETTSADGSPTLENLTFCDNYGITVLVRGSSKATIRSCVFSRSFSNVHVDDTATLTIVGCSMEGFDDAGIVCLGRSTVKVERTSFVVMDKATAIRVDNDSALLAIDCKFTGTQTLIPCPELHRPIGINAFFSSSSTLELINCRFEYLHYGVNGGNNTQLTIRGSSFLSCCFGIHSLIGADANAQLRVFASAFTGNSRGIALFGRYSLIEITDCEFRKNGEQPIQIALPMCMQMAPDWAPFDGTITGTNNLLEDTGVKRQCPSPKTPFWPLGFIRKE